MALQAYVTYSDSRPGAETEIRPNGVNISRWLYVRVRGEKVTSKIMGVNGLTRQTTNNKEKSGLEKREINKDCKQREAQEMELIL